MIIAVDGSAWAHRTGFGRFVRELVGALASRHPDIEIHLVLPAGAAHASIPPGIRVINLDDRVGASTATQARPVRAVMASLRAYATIEADLVWMPSLLGYVPVLRRVPLVIGVHDVIAHQFGRALFGRRRDALAWRLKTRLALMQAARIVTVSDYARTRLLDVLRIPADRVRIVGEAAAEVFAPVPSAIARATVADIGRACGIADLDAARLVVYHGAFAHHKNLDRLIDAFRAAAAQPELADVRLVLVGGAFRGTTLPWRGAEGGGASKALGDGTGADGDAPVPAVEAALIRLAAARLPSRVIFAGRLEDEPLRDLLSAATVAVLPSLEEGYGLTAIEASACGAAVIATRHSAIPEVLGDGALIVDPLDTQAIAAALTRVLGDAGLRDRLCDRARQRLADLTWARAADQLAAVFREVLDR